MMSLPRLLGLFHAAVLALRSCARPEAATLLSAYAADVPGDLHWKTLAVGSTS